MLTYIALLRGINVSGQKKIRMSDLRELFMALGYLNVVSYIQSGNVVFKYEKKVPGLLEEEVQFAIKDRFGFDVPVIIKTGEQWNDILESNPFKEMTIAEGNKMYYVLFKDTPETSLVEDFKEEKFKHEKCTIIRDCGYLVCFKGAGKAKLNNNLLERKLRVSATTRNHRTMVKLLEISGAE
ncbi:MAG TPA: DUF1697 domain-containing protein [Eudoraea sp.]|nr:DUF1697 domain-containing protein [Eudoraea sp.]